MWKAALEAVIMTFFDKAKEKAMDKIQEEAGKILDKLGVKLDALTEEAAQKIVEWKDSQDKETRRKMRAAWAVIAAFTFALGVGVGHFLL